MLDSVRYRQYAVGTFRTSYVYCLVYDKLLFPQMVAAIDTLTYTITDNDLTTKKKKKTTRMWANTQRDGRPAEYRWRPLFNAAKFR